MKKLSRTLLALVALVIVSEWPVPSDAYDWSRDTGERRGVEVSNRGAAH